MTRSATAITVLGSTNMDLVAYTPVAPRRGETVTGREFRTVPGGKGTNQAIAAARAGGLVTMIGAVGDDAFGPRLRDALTGAGVDTAALRTARASSGTAHIVVDDDGANSIVVVPGANATVTGLAPGDEKRVAAADTLMTQLELPMSCLSHTSDDTDDEYSVYLGYHNSVTSNNKRENGRIGGSVVVGRGEYGEEQQSPLRRQREIGV